MKDKLDVDICVIGAGSGGLSVTAAAAQMGIKVAIVEGHKMGGDCLNYGCVPSKALLAVAKRAHEARTSNDMGIEIKDLNVNFEKVFKYVHKIIDKISVNDSVERFTKLRATVIQKPGEFLDEKTLQAGETQITAKHFVIATGSSPSVPPIPGLESVHYYTNENIFDISAKPTHLIVIGGGPIGCELAQAFFYLGVNVTILEAFTIMPNDDKEVVGVLKKHLIELGLIIHEQAHILRIEKYPEYIEVIVEVDGKELQIVGSDILIAAGRRANTQGLQLEKAGVAYTKKGITVDARLRTSNKKIYAIGDVAGSFQFTHAANYHAGIAIRNIVFKLPAKVDNTAMPWVTYTEPELAHVGMSESKALKAGTKIKILESEFIENDRAQTEGTTIGRIKVVVNSRGKILGVTILGPHAGELILPWVIAIQEGKAIRSMTGVTIPYPTLNEISKRVANQFYLPLFASRRMKAVIRFLSNLG